MVYGKQKRKNGLDLVAALDALKLDPPPSAVGITGHDTDGVEQTAAGGDVSEEQKRPPLATRENNAVPHKVPSNSSRDDGFDESGDDGTEREVGKQSKGQKKAVDSLGWNRHQRKRVEDPTAAKTASQHPKAKKQSKATKDIRSESGIDITILTSLPDVKSQIKDFRVQAESWAKVFRITKIGQGGYASIFRLQLGCMPDKSAKYTVWKLMPLKSSSSSAGKGSSEEEGEEGEEAEVQTCVEDAATEVKALAAMSQSPGFVEFRGARVLRGALPECFQEACQQWSDARNGEDEVEVFADDQLWLFIEMTDAGTDLEQLLERGFPPCEGSGRKRWGKLRIAEAWDIFWGIVEALAHGEEHAEFEHRDLHPGNICIKRASPETERSKWPRERFTPYEVTLIDYTLSRAKVEEGEIFANLMKDRSIFEQTSDIEPDRSQYQAYRDMRRCVAEDSVDTEDEQQQWTRFVPQTNILWLHHIIKILLVNIRDPVRKNRKPKDPPPTLDDEKRLWAFQLLEEIEEHMEDSLRDSEQEEYHLKSARDLWNDWMYQEERMNGLLEPMPEDDVDGSGIDPNPWPDG